ncbi:MAG: hypothetical protein ACT4OM_13555 [Actinomycetota bacterium]
MDQLDKVTVAEQVTRTSRTAGTVLGAVSGARLGSVVVPVPVLGSLVGSVAGGLMGAGAGQWLGKALYRTTKVLLWGTGLVADKAAEVAGTAAGKTEVSTPRRRRWAR